MIIVEPPVVLAASLTVRLTVAEKVKIRRAANGASVSMSAWARKVLTA